ncbi:hypothetical protein [Bacteroides fragilis]|uniref:hypothetical protein n=1 Tax=Bacteroides fragilis TaxID=817 RepID=UPI001C6FF2E8|nr:hypothetical protein [Bacteroides fragilis]
MKTTISRKRIIIGQTQALTVSAGTSHPTGNQKNGQAEDEHANKEPVISYHLILNTL